MLLVAEPVLGPEEKKALSEVIDSGWITMGARVNAFEEAFAKMHEASDAVAVGSCTAALHLLLAAIGIGPGDEVIVPSMTFVATANCVLYVGATPVFADIEGLDTPLLSIEDCDARCTPKTRAVILMHYAGALADRSAWRDFAARRGLMLIEDAAHAIGIDGVGTYGQGAAFSFYGNKNMTTAEGGAVLASHPELLGRVRTMRGHGMTSGTFQRLSSRTPHYDVTMLGFNYRMDDLRAAIGLVQLERLKGWNERRKALVRRYRGALAQACPSVIVPFHPDTPTSNHIMPIVLPEDADREETLLHLRDNGIQTTIHYPPVHHLSYFRDLNPDVSLPATEEFGRRELTLPLHPQMVDGHVDQVVEALSTALPR